MFLVPGKVFILGHFPVVCRNGACYPIHNCLHFPVLQVDRGLHYDVAFPMSDQDFHCYPGIFRFPVCQIHKSTGNPVSHLVRMGRIYFFEHVASPFWRAASCLSFLIVIRFDRSITDLVADNLNRRQNCSKIHDTVSQQGYPDQDCHHV